MDPIDQLLYLCNHGGFHAWFRAKWLGDIARIHAEGQVDWQAVLVRAGNIGQEKPLLACLKLLHIVHGLPLPNLKPGRSQTLPSFLIDSPLYQIGASRNPTALGPLQMLHSPLRLIRYQKASVATKNLA